MLSTRWLLKPISPRRYHPPNSSTGGGAYCIGGGAMAMSAANAADDNKDAAPAATRYLTLRIGFVLLSGEADSGAPHIQKLTDGRWHQMFKRHLTLIFKVDILLRALRRRSAVLR